MNAKSRLGLSSNNCVDKQVYNEHKTVDLRIKLKSKEIQNLRRSNNPLVQKKCLTATEKMIKSTALKKNICETDEQFLRRRQKQIDYGKNTLGYDNYRKLVPINKRTKEDPKTPNKRLKYSRRGWDNLVKMWRIKLHKYDPEFVVKKQETAIEKQKLVLNNVKIENQDSSSTILESQKGYGHLSLNCIKTELCDIDIKTEKQEDDMLQGNKGVIEKYDDIGTKIPTFIVPSAEDFANKFL